jgi:hypothetical protein
LTVYLPSHFSAAIIFGNFHFIELLLIGGVKELKRSIEEMKLGCPIRVMETQAIEISHGI